MMLRKSNLLLRLFGALCLLGVAASAQALPITLTAGTANDSALFNFDFTGNTFTGLLSPIRADISWTGMDSTETAKSSLFADLNGVNFVTYGLATGSLGQAFLEYPAMKDGVFSILVEATVGSFTITGATAEGTDSSGKVFSIDGVLVSSVPSPAPLAILGLGLAGIGLTRRKRLS